jgi:Zn ribbon nucleic-acid-binding protein
MKRCPQCQSDDVKIVKYLNIEALICKSCGYDERDSYEMYPEGRNSQKEKGRFSPYKAGGSKRSMK